MENQKEVVKAIHDLRDDIKSVGFFLFCAILFLAFMTG